MVFRKSKRGYIADWRIVEFIVFWAMSGLTLTGRVPPKKSFQQFEAEFSLLMDIKRFLADAKCPDVDKFFAGISPEVNDLRAALLALSKKVGNESFLFLDVDGKPPSRTISYDNPSSDAD